MLSTALIFFLSLPSVLLSFNLERLPLPLTATGPESSAFDGAGAGPYTGVADGRILKYVNRSVGFVDFAVTSPNRESVKPGIDLVGAGVSVATQLQIGFGSFDPNYYVAGYVSKALCDGKNIPALGPTCGRPLGLEFNKLTGQLYIADAYRGLLVLEKNQKVATQLATSAEGVPFRSLDGLDVDPVAGVVYFTDASAVYQISQIELAVAKNDSTGRLLKYDIKTKQVTVLLRGLSGPAGAAVAANGTFLLVTEFIGNRIQKYWLKGPKANTAEVFIRFKGRPDNVKRNSNGDFRVAVNMQTPIPLVMKPEGIRLDSNGNITESMPIYLQYGTTLISEVQEFSGALYIGSMYTNFIGVYK